MNMGIWKRPQVDLRVAIVLVAWSALFSCSRGFTEPNSTDVPFEVIEGGLLRMFDRQRLVFRTPEAFEAEWTRMTEFRRTPPPLPPVDFDRHIVVFASLGSQGTLGFQIDVLRVVETSHELFVLVRESSGGSGCHAPAISAPVIGVVIPRTPSVVRFVEYQDFQC